MNVVFVTTQILGKGDYVSTHSPRLNKQSSIMLMVDSRWLMKPQWLALFLGILINAIATASVASQGLQNLPQLKEKLEIFLLERAAGLSGDISVSVAAFSPKLSLTHCDTIDFFFSGNNRAWGKTSVGIRCLSPVRWTIYAQANVSVVAEYVVTSTALRHGHTIQERDLRLQTGDLTLLPPNTLTRTSDAIGRITRVSMSPGALVKADNIEAQQVVQQGQKVRIFSQGSGFTLSTEGVALNSAAVGDLVRARVANGQNIQGVVKETGQVEVQMK